jgi:hypothetical protein
MSSLASVAAIEAPLRAALTWKREQVRSGAATLGREVHIGLDRIEQLDPEQLFAFCSAHPEHERDILVLEQGKMEQEVLSLILASLDKIRQAGVTEFDVHDTLIPVAMDLVGKVLFEHAQAHPMPRSDA